jgi:integrase
MIYRSVRPMKLKGRNNHAYIKRIPVDVLPYLIGRTLHIPVGNEMRRQQITKSTQSIRLSLSTNDPREVKALHAAVDQHLENVWQAYRQDAPVTLTPRQAVALAGEFYRAWATGEGRERTTALEHIDGKWVRTDDTEVGPDAWKPFDPKVNVWPIIERYLQAKGIGAVTEPSRVLLEDAFRAAWADASEARKRNAEGDYSPDPKANRFPEWTASGKPAAHVGFEELQEAWWKEAQATGAKPSTKRAYSFAFLALKDHLQHDDAARITKDDIIAFKEARVREGIAPATIKANLAAFKSVFGWAASNNKMASNPAGGVSIRIGKHKAKHRGFADEEAQAILRETLKPTGKRFTAQGAAARRWAPWLMAYTGARVGEMVQLRKADVLIKEKALRVLPEAGTVKDDEPRIVALHPHLIEMGFLDFVADAKAGYLFIEPTTKVGALAAIQSRSTLLAKFARKIVPDHDVEPNHGWRHRFKSECRKHGVDQEVRDYIQGHAPGSEGQKYGEVSLEAQAAALAKLPRYVIAGEATREERRNDEMTTNSPRP